MTKRLASATSLRPWLPILFPFLLAAAGCATNPNPFEGRETREVEVRVENQNYKDAVVYAIWGAGPRERLGQVTGNTTRTFSTRARATGEIRIEIDFIGGGPVQTQSMGVFEGDRIRVVIPPGI